MSFGGASNMNTLRWGGRERILIFGCMMNFSKQVIAGFGSLTSQPNTSKKPQRTSFTGGGSGGNGGSGWEDSKVVTFVVNSRAYIFVNENQYMFAIWCMILIQICLLVFMCQHLSFINAVQSKVSVIRFLSTEK